MKQVEKPKGSFFEIELSVMAKPIGSFFELELPYEGSLFHDSALALANGRVCFKTLLRKVQPTKVYVPFYTCDALILPLQELDIAYEFYPITTQLEPINLPILTDTELFVYINYFGMKSDYARQLSKQLGELLVVDNTQAFFEESFGKTWAFNSARKFFGVPDGGFLYSPYYLSEQYPPNNPKVNEHLWFQLTGHYDKAFDYFILNETEQTSEVLAMSDLTKRILYGVNFSTVARLRKRNFRILDRALQHLNQLPRELFEQAKTLIPFCYPLILDKTIDKAVFSHKNIILPILWTEVLKRSQEGFDYERFLALNILPLPIDHRLTEQDLRRIINFILSL